MHRRTRWWRDSPSRSGKDLRDPSVGLAVRSQACAVRAIHWRVITVLEVYLPALLSARDSVHGGRVGWVRSKTAKTEVCTTPTERLQTHRWPGESEDVG